MTDCPNAPHRVGLAVLPPQPRYLDAIDAAIIRAAQREEQQRKSRAMLAEIIAELGKVRP